MAKVISKERQRELALEIVALWRNVARNPQLAAMVIARKLEFLSHGDSLDVIFMAFATLANERAQECAAGDALATRTTELADLLYQHTLLNANDAQAVRDDIARWRSFSPVETKTGLPK